jgi:two-component system phosphate regulon response regulator PhoB
VAARRILLVDADAEARRELARGLPDLTLEPREAGTGASALEIARREHPDVIVVGFALPDISGLGLCRLVREDTRLGSVALIMVSDRAAEIDRVLAFESGVDDFLPRPFHPRELAARVSAVLRRSAELGSAPRRPEGLAAGLVSVDTERSTVRVRGERVELTRRELELLATLMRESGRVVSRQELIQRVWGESAQPTRRSVDAHIKAIRRKLGSARDCVQTVRGVGYRFTQAACG